MKHSIGLPLFANYVSMKTQYVLFILKALMTRHFIRSISYEKHVKLGKKLE